MLAVLIMGKVPLVLTGLVAALWIAGQPLSVASMVGFITLTDEAIAAWTAEARTTRRGQPCQLR